jgi:hypothetical protein
MIRVEHPPAWLRGDVLVAPLQAEQLGDIIGDAVEIASLLDQDHDASTFNMLETWKTPWLLFAGSGLPLRTPAQDLLAALWAVQMGDAAN